MKTYTGELEDGMPCKAFDSGIGWSYWEYSDHTDYIKETQRI